MSMSIQDMRLRINTLERIIEHNQSAYVAGYVRALQERGELLYDVDPTLLNEDFLSGLHDLYRSQLYAKKL